ncbi:MAG: ETC complex I subunit [Alphaproteobacteria bacterium]
MSLEVRIFKPCKNPMQSGRAKTHGWAIAFKPKFSTPKDPLMGWTASQDMREELHLRFPSLEDAIAYADQKQWLYVVETPPPASTLQPKSYADNFTLGRLR